MNQNEDEGEITDDYLRVAQGDRLAFARLFSFYYGRLCKYVRPMLSASNRGVGFEEDLSAEVMERIWELHRKMAMREPRNQDEIWHFIAHVARCAARDRRRYQNRRKRIAWSFRLIDSIDREYVSSADEISIDFRELWSIFLSKIESESGTAILNLILDGVPIKDIGPKVGLTERTVYRQIQYLEALWDEVEKRDEKI